MIKLAAKGTLSSYIEKKLTDLKSKPNFIPLTSVGPGTSVFMNSGAVKPDGSVDFIVNFRGIPGDAGSIGKSVGNANAVVITAEAVGKGDNKGSAMLVNQFASSGKVNEMVGTVLNYLKKQFPDKEIKRGKLIISGFSGGGAVVARLAAEQANIKGGIDGIIINDGLHSEIGSKPLDAIVEFARQAQKDPSKKFKIIHTAIKPGYTSTTETADHILKQLGIERQKTDSKNFKDYGFEPASVAQDGGVEIIQMYDKPAPYYVDNRPGSLGDQHVQSLRKGHPYLFRDVFI